jgi:glycosyltransferase involved in cell wall biosynthesis
MNNSLSVIIPTKNEQKNIRRCLESIKNQDMQPAEVILIDNYSSDQTISIARQFGAKVFLAGPERSVQRNFGAKKASGKFLLFLDADMELEKGVLQECLDLAEDGAQAVIISERVVGKGFWSRCRTLEKSCYLGDELIEAARFYDKKLFLQLGGYDKELIASEDWDLHQKAKNVGAKIARTKSFVLHHEKETNPIAAFRKKYYYGKNLSAYFKKHPKLALAQYQPLRPAFLRNIKKLISQPLLAIGLVILKSAEYLGGGFGILRGKLK